MSSPEFYSNAQAYDIAFSDRNFVDECNFLDYCLQTYGAVALPRGGVSPGNRQSFLELACGPGRHAQEFACRGWRAVGLDLSPEMLEYARSIEVSTNRPVTWHEGDMCDFILDEPVSLAANLMESLSHLTTNESVVNHLRAVSSNLVSGGIFVIEMAHPDTIWRDSLPNSWRSKSTENPIFGTIPPIDVDVLFGAADDHYDWVDQIWTVTTRLDIHEDGKPSRVVESKYPHRWYQAQELRALIDLSEAFSKTWFLGNMVIPPPRLDNSENSQRMVVVLRK